MKYIRLKTLGNAIATDARKQGEDMSVVLAQGVANEKFLAFNCMVLLSYFFCFSAVYALAGRSTTEQLVELKHFSTKRLKKMILMRKRELDFQFEEKSADIINDTIMKFDKYAMKITQDLFKGVDIFENPDYAPFKEMREKLLSFSAPSMYKLDLDTTEARLRDVMNDVFKATLQKAFEGVSDKSIK